MKLIIFLAIVFIAVPAYCQFTGPDAANRIYYSKGFVGIGDVPLYRFHLKATDDKPLLFAETLSSTISYSGHLLDLRTKDSFNQTPAISWYAPSGMRQAYFGLRNDAFGLTLENNFNFLINGGNVGIGTADTKGYMLAVAGKFIAEEVVVKLKGNWPDYVFDPLYNLPPLDEVMGYIAEHKRLPGMPPASDVSSTGIKVSEVTSLLVKKVEELTLYLAAEKKHSSEMAEKITALEHAVRNRHEHK
jgi:hypothetical protein